MKRYKFLPIIAICITLVFCGCKADSSVSDESYLPDEVLTEAHTISDNAFILADVTEKLRKNAEDKYINPPSVANGTLKEVVDYALWVALHEPPFPMEGNTTIYGELYGDPEGQWCTEFLQYCLESADIEADTDYLGTVYPELSSAYRNGLWFKAWKRWFPKEGYIPKVGDFVCMDTIGEGYPNHSALVAKVIENEYKNKIYILTVEGNIPEDKEKGIRFRVISSEHPQITGYGSPWAHNLNYDGPIKYYSDKDKPIPEEELPYEENSDAN